MNIILSNIPRKVTSTLLCCWFTVFMLNAQSSFNFIPSGFHDYYFQPKNLGISTPQAADFQKYGNMQIDHYNGLLNMEIQLDGYKDRDFDLPLSIKYVSQGFIPSKRPSIVGMNWFLNFGGVITRVVKGSPDDTKGNYVSDSRKYMKDGLLVAMRNGTYIQYSDNDLTNFRMPMNSSYHASGDLKFDYEPDIFSFNFGKHQGSFIIGQNKTPVCLSGSGYKIDISGLSMQEYSTTSTPVESFMKITTPDGYIYEFGGNNTCLEYNIPNNPDKAAVNPRFILSWYLKSIKSPNNREVQFTYDSRQLPNHYNYYLYSENKSAIQIVGGTVSNSGDENSLKMEIKDKVYSPIIQKITIDAAEIRFTTISDIPFFDVGDPSFSLSKISLYYNSQPVKETTLNYEAKGKYLFLSSLTKNGEKYNFVYNPINPPSPLTTSIDHWGFWNGSFSTNVTDIKNYCLNIESNRVCNPNMNGAGLLWQVTYPTGGMTEITYEQNTYSRFLEKSVDKYELNLKVLGSNANCGGSRVCKISDYDPTSNKSYSARSFEYKIPEANAGSGIIYLKPKYLNEEVFATTGFYPSTNQGFILYNYIKDVSSNSLGFRENYPEYHIGYSDVIERYSDGGYIHYEYTSHVDTPNSILGLTYKLANGVVSFSSKPHGVLEKTGLYITNDLSPFRGKLKRQRNYNSLGNLKQSLDYTYNVASAQSTYNTSVASAHRGFSSYRIYTTPCLLLSKKVTDSNNVVCTEYYSYNNKSLISEKNSANSDGTGYSIRYRYPTDYPYTSLNDGGRRLVDCNMISSPMKIFKTVRDGIAYNTPIIKEALVFDYKTANAFSVIDNIKELQSPAPVEENSNEFNNNLVTKEKYIEYDLYGNPTYIIRNDSTKTVYIWGYRMQCLIAEIKNATRFDVLMAIGGVNGAGILEALTYSPIPSDYEWEFIIKMQKHPRLANAHVTIYKHKPLIGISEIIDPMGMSTYYDYDSSGRTKEIYIKKGSEKQILESFDYHYKNQ